MSRHKIFVAPEAGKEIKRLPGNMRQRVKRAIDDLAQDPRPMSSKELDLLRLAEPVPEVRRLRIENWRILYSIDEVQKVIDVFAVRKRPPYDYGDLASLISSLAH